MAKKYRHNTDVIDYAFMFKGTNFPGVQYIYVLLQTNYYMIARYAANQTKNYEEIDMHYVNFLANLPTLRIKAISQYSPVGAGLYAYTTEAKFVLLKNSVKIKESDEIPLYQEGNPYYVDYLSGPQTNWQQVANETVKQTMIATKELAKAYQMELKINPDDIPSYSIGKQENLYNYNDIDTNSKYEVVVIYENGEKRIPIDFSRIK